nr:MAG TPA: hypothetical protein [Bacteriophage sp.]
MSRIQILIPFYKLINLHLFYYRILFPIFA